MVSSASQALSIVIDPLKPFVRDMTKEGWKLVSDIQYQSGKVELELMEFLKSGESRIEWKKMARRAVKLNANFGQKHAEAFLAKYERWTPPEGVDCIIFPGTVFRQGSLRSRFVSCLYWYDGRWHLSFYWPGSGWYSSVRLLRSRK